MNTREEFEKWANENDFDVSEWSNGKYNSGRTVCAAIGWNARQPEIDALIHDNNNMRKTIAEYDKENAALKSAIPDGDDRVYACLTACVGIPTETLEDLPGTFAEILLRAEEREKNLKSEVEKLNEALTTRTITALCANAEKIEVVAVTSRDEKLRKAGEKARDKLKEILGEDMTTDDYGSVRDVYDMLCIALGKKP